MRGFGAIGLLLMTLAPSEAQAQFTGMQRPAPPARNDWSIAGSRSTRIDTQREQRDIRDRIDHGREAGQLSHRDAQRLRRENGQLGVLTDRYASDGLSSAEAGELDARAAILRDQVNIKRIGSAAPPRS